MPDTKIVCGPKITFAKDLEETTLDELLIAAAQKRSNDVYLIEALSNEKLTVEEFLQKSYSLAAELQHLGCNKNTIVGIVSENRLEYPIVVLGTILTGATLTCYNSAYTVDELKPVFNVARPSIVFCSSENCAKLQRIVSPSNSVIVFDSEDEASSSDESSHRKFSQLVQSTKSYTNVEKSPNDVACILYSSGTTGLPKGVMLTHRNIVHISKIAQLSVALEKTSCLVKVLVTPMFHSMGFHTSLLAIIRNETLVIMRRYDIRLYLSTIQKYRIERLSVVPTVLEYLMKNPILDEYDLSCVQSVTCGSAPLKYETEQAFKNKFRLKYVQQGYGLTEATLACTVKSIENIKAGTCGSPIPGVEMKVVDVRTGGILGKNETGEICVKGPNIMKGYYGNETATAEAFDKDGWLRTGDIGYYDVDNDFFIVDRVKELIKYKGFQVPPAELEALLLTHPDVVDCGVVGIPDEVAGELPRAYIVKQVGAKITENEIIQYIAGKVSLQKRLRGGVQFVDDIPRNASGKILRRKLRELWTVNCKSKL